MKCKHGFVLCCECQEVPVHCNNNVSEQKWKERMKIREERIWRESFKITASGSCTASAS